MTRIPPPPPRHSEPLPCGCAILIVASFLIFVIAFTYCVVKVVQAIQAIP